MASGIVITAALLFAVRGMFLGFNGVIARLVGMALGYYVAYSYRADLSTYVVNQYQPNFPEIVIQTACAMALFFVAWATGSVAVSLLFKVLGNAIPGFKQLFNQDTVGGKITGALVNSAIGAAIALMGLWAFSTFTGKADISDPTQQLANRWGDSLFALLDNPSLPALPAIKGLSSAPPAGTKTERVANSDGKGSIIILSLIHI